MRTPAGIRRSGQVAWTLAIAIAGAYGIYLHVPQATQPEPPIRHMASDDTLWVLSDPTDLNRTAVSQVPLLVSLDATGALIGVRVGSREAPDQVGW